MEREEILQRLHGLRQQAAYLGDLLVRMDDIAQGFNARTQQLVQQRQSFTPVGVSGRTRAGTSFVMFAGAMYALLISIWTHDIISAMVLAGVGFALLHGGQKGTALTKIAMPVGIVMGLILLSSVARALIIVDLPIKIMLVVFAVISAFVSLGTYRIYVRKDAARVERANIQIQQTNASITLANEAEIQRTRDARVEYDRVVQAAQQAYSQLQTNAQGWYPPDYLTLPALDRFVEMFANLKVDTIKEAVNLYDAEDRHHEHMEVQRSIRNQVMLGNVLKVAQIGLQMQTISSIRDTGARLEAAQRETTSAIHSQTGAIQDHTRQVRQGNAALRDIRRRL